MQPPDWQIALVLAIGVSAASTAAILVRLAIAAAGVSGVGFSLVLAASRLSLAAIVLLPTGQKIYVQRPTPVALGYAAAAGMALAIHFATWITSLSYTSIAASTTLVTTSPIWVALLSWFWSGEKPSRLTLLGTGIALAGSLLIGLGGGDSNSTGTDPLLGNGLALMGALAASIYFLLGREAQRQGLSTGHYATVAYSTAAIVLLPLPLLVGATYTGYTPLTYVYMGLIAFVPQLIGHTSLNWSVRWVSPTLVTLVILFEPVASSILGYWLFGEIPGALVLVGAMVLLVGVAIAAIKRSAKKG
ncbi:DMT family transporter [Kovacikia minuta CCNUW1]|uniref:DMT family transporter n=1 Tax=Kovacikia minuta TaxID=2931930 RepID=UPI001CCC9BEB|nr:DMT family transporter [Kovacikia minuta]UBF27640.1 DMT family transporter [Kovacikia minuta CCNUW1]